MCVFICFALLCVSLSHIHCTQDLHQQLDHAESEIKSEQQKRADADEAVANMQDQLEGVRSALSSQVMDLDQQLSGSQEQCSELQRDKVRWGTLFCIRGEEVVAWLSPVQGSLSAFLSYITCMYTGIHNHVHMYMHVYRFTYVYTYMYTNAYFSGCGGRGSWSDTERTGGHDSAEVSGHHPVIVVATIPWSRSRDQDPDPVVMSIIIGMKMLCLFHFSLPQGRPGIVSVISTGGGGKEGEGVGGGGGEEGGGGPGPQSTREAAPEQPGHLPARESTGLHTMYTAVL